MSAGSPPVWHHRDTSAENTYGAGARAAVPLVLPTVLIGASFGVAAASAGWGVVAPIVMSAVLVQGAAQFAVLAVVAAGGGIAEAVVAATLIASRYLAIGAAFGPSMRGGPVRRALEGQAVLDTSAALARIGPGRFGVPRLLGSTVPQYLGWVAGTALGAVAGGRVADPEAFGVDVIFPAFFLALLVRDLGDRSSRVTIAAGVLIALVLVPIAPPGIPVIAACAGVLVGGAGSR